MRVWVTIVLLAGTAILLSACYVFMAAVFWYAYSSAAHPTEPESYQVTEQPATLVSPRW